MIRVPRFCVIRQKTKNKMVYSKILFYAYFFLNLGRELCNAIMFYLVRFMDDGNSP